MKPLRLVNAALMFWVFLGLGPTAFAHPDHVVLGYVPCRRDSIASPDDFNYDAFTHLARAFIREKDDGSLDTPANYFDEKFESAARSHGVKILMSIGGGAAEADHWLPLARDPAHVQLFLTNVEKLLDAHHYDGIDIDWEPPPLTDDDGRIYADFLKTVHQRFPKCLLTLAMSPTKKSTAHIPMPDVIANIDLINAMTYSYATASSGLASFNANLHADIQAAHTRHSVEEDMQNLLETHHIPPSKLLLGMTFWGSRFHVDHLGDNFPSHSRGYADSVTFSEINDLLTTGNYTALRDTLADAPYLVGKKGGCVITYDDPASIHSKCEAAIKLKCAGVIIWHIGADAGGGESPLLSAVDESFGMAKLPLSRQALEHEVARLSRKPLPGDSTVESLLNADSKLRNERGMTEDKQWSTAPRP